MKTLKTMLLSAGAVAMLGASGLYAQKATADIPFEFTVQGTRLPAGQYEMSNTSTRDVLVIRNADTKKVLLVMAAGSGQWNTSPDQNVVVFHRTADRYFLADVKTWGVRGHLIPCKDERELVKEGAGQPVAAVILPALNVR